MKLLAVFFLLGVALASAVPLFIDDDLESEIDQIADELDDEFIVYAEGGLGQRLRERLEKLIEDIKSRFDKGEDVDGMMGKAKDFIERLKKFGLEMSEKFKQIYEDLLEKIRGGKTEQADIFNFKDLLRKLRDRLQGEFDVEKIREHVEKVFGKSEITDQLLKMIQDKGGKARQRILDFINRILGDEETQDAVQHGIFDRMKKQFEDMVTKMKEAMDGGKEVSENHMKKANDIYEKLTNLGVEISDKIKEVFEELKNKLNKNSVAHAELSIAARLKERFENLINRMKKNMDDGKGVRGDLMKKANDIFEKFKNMGIEVSDKIKSIFEDLRSKFQRTSAREDRSIKEIYEKVKNYFKDLNIELKEKFTKFGEYVKEQYNKALDKSKSNVENVKKIAKEFLDDGKKISKDLAEEALEFFRDYKNDLGKVFEDVKEKVREILKKEA